MKCLAKKGGWTGPFKKIIFKFFNFFTKSSQDYTFKNIKQHTMAHESYKNLTQHKNTTKA